MRHSVGLRCGTRLFMAVVGVSLIGCASAAKPRIPWLPDLSAADELAVYEVAVAEFIKSARPNQVVYVSVDGRSAPRALVQGLRKRTGRRVEPYWKANRNRGRAVLVSIIGGSVAAGLKVTVGTVEPPGMPTLSGLTCDYVIAVNSAAAEVVSHACALWDS